MPVQTALEFRTMVSKSGLLQESVVDEHFATAVAATPNDAAKSLVNKGLLTRFQASMLLSGRHRGLMLGPYKLLDQLGHGGMGIVYLAEHQKLFRRVALKILPLKNVKDTLALERFYREARAVAALDHPNIVKAYDVGEYDGVHFLAMEYVKGINLQSHLDEKGPLPWKAAVGLIAQACRGLEHAHQRGLVHRDIKPGNLLVDRRNTLKILDLGLARCFRSEQDNVTAKFAQNEELTGSLDFMAPEVARGEQAIDIRADIYSLGLTFHAFITGKSPYEGTPAQKLLYHQVKELPLLHEVQPGVPPELSAVVARMTQKQPQDRFATPGEVLAALAPWLPAAAAPPPSTIRMKGGSQTTTVVQGSAASVTTTQPAADALPQAMPEEDEVPSPALAPLTPKPTPKPVPKVAPKSAARLAPRPAPAPAVTATDNKSNPDKVEEDEKPQPAKPKRRRFKPKHGAGRHGLLLGLVVGLGAAVILIPLTVVGAIYALGRPESTQVAAATPPPAAGPDQRSKPPAGPPAAPPKTPAGGAPRDPTPPAPPPPAPGPGQGPEVGKLAPEISNEDLDGECFMLSDHRGSVVLVDFWGFWCPHCVKMIPHEKVIVDRMKSRPFVMLGVNSDEKAAAIKSGMATHQVNWRSFKNLRTDGEKVSTAWGVKGWPTLFLIDHNGVIREKWVGAPEDKVMEDRIEALVREAEAAKGKKS